MNPINETLIGMDGLSDQMVAMDWIVNSKSNSFFKGFLTVLNRRHIA